MCLFIDIYFLPFFEISIKLWSEVPQTIHQDSENHLKYFNQNLVLWCQVNYFAFKNISFESPLHEAPQFVWKVFKPSGLSF